MAPWWSNDVGFRRKRPILNHDKTQPNANHAEFTGMNKWSNSLASQYMNTMKLKYRYVFCRMIHTKHWQKYSPERCWSFSATVGFSFQIFIVTLQIPWYPKISIQLPSVPDGQQCFIGVVAYPYLSACLICYGLRCFDHIYIYIFDELWILRPHR